VAGAVSGAGGVEGRNRHEDAGRDRPSFCLSRHGRTGRGCEFGVAEGLGSGDRSNFRSPEEAATTLVSALRTDKPGVAQSVLGPGSEKLISSGDKYSDAAERQKFLAAYDAQHKLVPSDSGQMVLQVGTDNWPFPIPLVQGDGGWHFDPETGAQELVNRRIGRNEIAAIRTSLAYLGAQRVISPSRAGTHNESAAIRRRRSTMADELCQRADERIPDLSMTIALIEGGILVLLVIGLLIGVLAVVKPFTPAILFGAALATTAWPIRQVLIRRGLGRVPAAALLLLLSLMLIVLPMLVVAPHLADQMVRGAERVQSHFAATPEQPAWIKSLPLFGRRLGAAWDRIVEAQGNLRTLLEPYAANLEQLMIGAARAVADSLIQVLLSLVVAAMFWTNGDGLVAMLHEALRRLGGPIAEVSAEGRYHPRRQRDEPPHKLTDYGTGGKAAVLRCRHKDYESHRSRTR